MGLDSIWILPDGVKEPVFRPGLQLINGGRSVFRGTVYNEFIETITGISLYQETIPNSTIKEMAEKLKSYNFKPNDPDNPVMGYPYESDEDQRREFNDLVRMFTTYAKAGARLHGWW